MAEIFASSTRSSGDVAGVFEYDGETGHFYLYRTAAGQGTKVVDALPIVAGELDFARADLSIRWDRSNTKVGLFIRGVMWALFDCSSGRKFGGQYRANDEANIPADILFQ